MKIDLARTRKLLKAFDFATLFREELGWEPKHDDLTVTVAGQAYSLQSIAQKRGFMALWLKGQIPDYATRRKIDALVEKSYHEHLIVYTDAGQTEQRWQWVKREAGKPAASRESAFKVQGSGDSLLQKLEYLAVTLDEEEYLTILDMAERVKAGFNIEKVTKKFYERFKDEHAAFLKFLGGIPDSHLQRWYVSITLNRLMFVYFVQKKGFLDGDPDYLRHKLAASKRQGENLFYTNFLCPLFFEGFAKRQHTPQALLLLGNVPYLNGGIFERHQIETLHGEKIQIPDVAFERLFDFFDGYQWRLDERPLRRENEINPDVLGYIFEKYINQKQMGAYYTKEDITEYISKNTIVPHLFDVAQKECKVAFEGEGSVWRHLQADPDRYIYTALRHGAELALPTEIAAGLEDVARREGWNKSAPEEFALPTEIWREVVARRRRYQEVKAKLEAGEVTSINDLVTLNLDIRQFAQDVIQDSDAELLLAFWKAISQIKVLDPTVGSGAFLFAALNVLEPLYEACLERMSALVEELDRSGGKHSPKKYEPFRKVLAQVRQRPDEDYFIFKSIIINNLYGVDIMEEAVEICKLRLFLKLASQVEPDPAQENLGIEPLPDIDFNIRAGNTLVGFATREDVKRSVEMSGQQQAMIFAEENQQLRRIEEKAADVDRLYKLFRLQQTEYGGEVRPEDKRELQKRLGELEKELNILLAKQYAIHNPKGEAYKKWLESHTPFHWFVEFFGIMNEGGFDVIIGNPPYIEYSQIKKEYLIRDFQTEKCGNLYAFVIENCYKIARKNGRLGMIVQLSSICTDRMAKLQKVLSENSYDLWISNYDDRPGKLFDGLEHIRASIIVSNISKSTAGKKSFTTKLNRWNTEYRPMLFSTLEYENAYAFQVIGSIPKLGNRKLRDIVTKVLKIEKTIGSVFSPSSTSIVYYYRSPLYWIRSMNFLPFFESEEANRSVHHFKNFNLSKKEYIKTVGAIINSTMFYFWFIVFGNGRNVALRDIQSFPCDVEAVFEQYGSEFSTLFDKLMKDYKDNSYVRTRKDGVKFQEFYPSKSKPIIDEIDRALARHYGLSDEELDFIIHYDIKYRMGASAGEEGMNEPC